MGTICMTNRGALSATFRDLDCVYGVENRPHRDLGKNEQLKRYASVSKMRPNEGAHTLPEPYLTPS